MRTLEEIKKEKVYRTFRMIMDSGIPMMQAEAKYLADKVGEILGEGLAEMSTSLPRRRSGNMYRIQTNGELSADGYHPINGQWRRITQLFDGETTLYYTDGERERVAEKK